MTDRRFLLAVGGALVGAIGGAAAAVNGAPVAGLIAAVGAVAAGAGVLLSPADPRDAHSSTVGSPRPSDSSEPAPAAAAPAPTASAPATAAVHPPPSPAPTSPPAPTSSAPDDVDDGPPSSPPLLTDPTTGLFSEDYFNIAIEARLAAARRHLRPVGVVLLDVVEGLRVDNVRPTDPGRVAEAIRATLREADTACRRPDGKFALLLEDTPENGAIWTVERIRRRLVDANVSLTVWAGIACYPAHAFDKESILRSADLALDAAREWRQDRIEVATGD